MRKKTNPLINTATFFVDELPGNGRAVELMNARKKQMGCSHMVLYWYSPVTIIRTVSFFSASETTAGKSLRLKGSNM
jgi:hypothetical protein